MSSIDESIESKFLDVGTYNEIQIALCPDCFQYLITLTNQIERDHPIIFKQYQVAYCYYNIY